MASVSHKTATASIWTIGGKLFARMLDFVSLVVLARLLRPEDFGLVAIATSVLVIVEAVLDLPLTQALIRQPSLTKRMLDTAFTLSLLRGAAISFTMMMLAWPIAYFYDDPRLVPLVAVLSIAPSMRSVISPRMVLFMQRFDFKREFALDIITKAATLFFAVGVALATGSYWGLAVGAIAGPFTAAITSYVFAPMRPHLTLSEWSRFRDMIGWNTVSQILSSINWQLDRLLLPRFTSLSTFGAFSVADNLAGIPHQTFVGPLMRPLMAAFSSLEEHNKLVAAYLKGTSAIVLVAAPVLLILAFLAQPIVRVTVGDNWADAAPILRWLCVVSIVALPSTMMPALAMVLDNTRFVAFRMLAEFAMRAPATLVGIAYFGLVGAIVARVVAMLVAYAASMVITRRLIGATLGAQLNAFIRPLAASLPMIGFLACVQPQLAQMSLGLNLIGSLALCGAAALLIFWACALALWQLAERPDGLEAIIVQKFLLRRKRAVTP